MTAYDENNIFAKILRGELPAHKIYEDDESFAFLDIMPRSKGHTLVIPKKPAVNLLDIDPDDLCTLMRTVHKLAPMIVKATKADGFILQQFNEAAAGQMVFHIHFHIVPRFVDVPLKHPASEVERDEILIENAETIRTVVAQESA